MLLHFRIRARHTLPEPKFASNPKPGLLVKDTSSRKIRELLSAFRDCSRARDLRRGKVLHHAAMESGLESDIYVATAVVNMYSKCGSLTEAKTVFDCMPRRDAVAWSTLLLGYVENGEAEVTLQTFFSMQTSCQPNARAFMAALMACASLADKEDGRKPEVAKLLETGTMIHSKAKRAGCDHDMFVASTLVDMYSKCGSMVCAHRAFDNMSHLDVVPWTALLLGYAENGEPEFALEIFHRMKARGCSPNSRTFVAALVACANLASREQNGSFVEGKLVKLGCLEKGMAVHLEAKSRGYAFDRFVANTLVDFYGKCGSILDARMAFDRNSSPDVVSWNSLLLAYVENGFHELGYQVFEAIESGGFEPNARTFVVALMAVSNSAKCDETVTNESLIKTSCLEKGKKLHRAASRWRYDTENVYVVNALIDMYSKCADLNSAVNVFKDALHRDTASWNTLILGCVENGEGHLALEHFVSLYGNDEYSPNARTYVNVLTACGAVAAVEAGNFIQLEIFRRGLETDILVHNRIVDFHGKCGSMSAAQHFFDIASDRDVVLWNALIAGYSHQGDTESVFTLFGCMLQNGVRADSFTLMSLLKACSHAGLLEQAEKYFTGMQTKLSLSPRLQHYTCMIDLLGRANKLEPALRMLETMPLEPDVVAWTALLSACHKWKNAELGRRAYDSVLRLDGKQPAAFVLMGNIYGSLGMWEEKEKVLAKRARLGAWKEPGQSWWNGTNGSLHVFRAGDRSHPQTEKIYRRLSELHTKMKEDGYVADVLSVVRELREEDKEDALCWHSERLAIGCGLINTAAGVRLKVFKNLRVCNDCHKAIALISKIEQRAIICRDISRFHNFINGKCSCGDYW